MAGKSLPPVSAKLVADAEQFIAEFRRAERAAAGTTGKIGNEVDKLSKTLGKKFSFSDFGKDILKGFGVGSGFAVIDTIFGKVAEAFEAHQQKLKKIDDTWAEILTKSKEYQRSLLSPDESLKALEGDLERLQKKYQELVKPREMEVKIFTPGGGVVTSKVKPAFGSSDEMLAVAENLKAQQEMGIKIAEARKKMEGDRKKDAEQQKKDLIEISKLHAATWGAMEKNYASMLADMPEEEFDSRRNAIEDMFYSGVIGAEAASRAIKDLDADQGRWTKETTAAAQKHMAAWQELFDVINDAGMAEATANNAEYAADDAARAAKDMGWAFQSAFEDAIIGGEKFSDVLKAVAQDVMRIAIRSAITQPLGNWIGGMFSGIFGGGKASGGSVQSGTSYMVGEKGPEMFTPSTSGNITPNHSLGGGDNSKTFYIDARGADRTGLSRLESMIRSIDGSIENRAIGAVMDFRRRGATA